ncbi:MAG: hypothetical protein P8Q97_10275 [Myxococcota bacterium]|jgi:hypothetical protein|nr:hypothetical protein [Myxococcota bacterium]
MPNSKTITHSLKLTAGSVLAALVATSSFADAGPQEPPEPMAWVVSESPAELVETARTSLHSEMRAEMTAALEPESAIWAGALDGQRVAERMRIQLAQETAGDMAAEMKVAITTIPLQGHSEPVHQKVRRSTATWGPQLAGQFETAPQPAGTDWP